MLKILTLTSFEKAYKKYKKKYKNIEKDLKKVILALEENPEKGILLKNNIFKIRIKNSDNNKGKSNGYRIIYFYKIKGEIIFTYIYSKNELDNISEDFIDDILTELSDFI